MDYIHTHPNAVTNSYKPLQTSYSENRYKPSYSENHNKPLQTIYSLIRYEPLQYQSDTTV